MEQIEPVGNMSLFQVEAQDTVLLLNRNAAEALACDSRWNLGSGMPLGCLAELCFAPGEETWQ